MTAHEFQHGQILLLMAHRHVFRDQRWRVLAGGLSALELNLRCFMVHIEHVPGLIPVVAGRVDSDPTLPVYSLQVIRLLPLHRDRLQ